MIEAVTVERFRGLRRLEVEGFGRVNLIIGKNNCGKTALLEAVAITTAGTHAAHALLNSQLQRQKRSDVHRGDFDCFWRPLFWHQDADAGFSIERRSAGAEPMRLLLRKLPWLPTVLTELPAAVVASAWTLELRTMAGEERTERIVGSPAGVQLPGIARPPAGAGAWTAMNKASGEKELILLSRLRQAGREAELLDVLREVESRVSGIEILGPAGPGSELFVRLEPGSPPLPLAMMGNGFQRCFKMAVTAMGLASHALFIDEIDNGMHHSLLERVWRWLALLSSTRDIQLFATAQSDECIHAACRAFTALNDGGLRVIRLDRHEDHTAAAVYDRTLVETAAQAGVELRG